MYNRLYYNRVRCRLTQQELAEAASVSRSTVCRLEKDGRYPGFQTALRLCRALQCDFQEVFPLDVLL